MEKGGLEDELNPAIRPAQHRLSDSEKGLGQVQGSRRALDGHLITEQFRFLSPPPE